MYICELNEKTLRMEELEDYVKQNLPTALKSVIESERLVELHNLSIYEKAVIFAYTDARNQQHQLLNELLWRSKGSENTDFGRFLESSLDKLENYTGMVFRGVQESNCDIERYIKAQENKLIITEFAFLSASKFQIIAQGFGRIVFRIYAKRAKDIEKISKFKKEKEVVFGRNTSFKVVKITNTGFYIIITLKEI